MLLAGIIVLIVFRRPELFLAPRFWAEEGANYFAYAFNNGFLDALVVQHFGYYAIVPTITTALSTLVPLEQAPLVTTLVAAVFQLLVSSVVIFGSNPLWDSWPKKCLLAFGIQLLNPFEVWLTTIGTQYWMTIALFLILLERRDPAAPLRTMFHRGMVLIGGLSGGQPLFLFPAYLLKAARTRNREERLLCGILCAAGLVQAAAFIAAKIGKDPYFATRFGKTAFSLPWFLEWHFIEPFVSLSIFDTNIAQNLDATLFPLLVKVVPEQFAHASAMGIAILVAGGTASVLFSNRRDLHHQLTALSYLTIIVMSTLLSLQMASSPRYAFAPAIITLALFIASIPPAHPPYFLRAVAGIIVTSALVSSLHDFRKPIRIYYSPDFPQWKDEVAAWRLEPRQELAIWPRFDDIQWHVTLYPPESREKKP
jgi:hypothetical protein